MTAGNSQPAAQIRFGTDGWRALMTEDFTEPNLRLVVEAVASRVLASEGSERGVVVGFDSRRDSQVFAHAASEVLAMRGIPVHLTTRPTPTPVVAYTILQLGASGGVMITASHNPPDYNGIKFIASHGGPAPAAVTAEIEREIAVLQADPTRTRPHVIPSDLIQPVDLIDDYRAEIGEIVNYAGIREAALRVGVDPMYGAGYGLLDQIATDAGCHVQSIHNHPDPTFGGGMPEPAPAHLGELKQLVLGEGLDVGVALDGDGDRFGAVDRQGYMPSSNEILALLAEYLVGRGHRGALVRSVATTHLLDAIAERHGLPLVETPVGFKHVSEVMIEQPVVLGGEESGGLSVGKHIPEKDGILANMLIIELLAEKKRSFQELLADLERTYGVYRTERIDIHIEPEAKSELMRSLRENPPERMAGLAVAGINKIDGVKLLLEGGDWVLVRPSGTEPMVRVYVESRDAQRFERVRDKALGVVKGPVGV